MSNSALVSYTRISPNRNSPRTQPISKITVHHMAGSLSLPQFGELVANPARQMSANYAIDKYGSIGLYCEEGDRSWCSSSPWNDHRAVTIEVANDGGAPDWHVSDKSLAALIDLCTDICRRNGMRELVYTGNQNGSLTMHCYYSATACPGPYLKSRFSDIANQVTARLQPVPAVPKLQHVRVTCPDSEDGAQVGRLMSTLRVPLEATVSNGDALAIMRLAQTLGAEYKSEYVEV